MKPETTPHSRPAWREPMFWLVLAGPIGVVVACIITGVLIFNRPDVELNDHISAASLPKSGAAQPAQAARNHSATASYPR